MMRKFIFALVLIPCFASAQIEIVRNGSFEGDFIHTVPLQGEDMYQNSPPEWEQYVLTNSDDDEKWLTDSLFFQPNGNLPNTPYNNAYYSASACDAAFDSAGGKSLMQASTGRFYIGFNNSNDGNREGVQQDLGCDLNSGNYTLQYDWARPFMCNGSVFKVHLSKVKDTRRKLLVTQNSNIGTIPGFWYTRSENFQLNLNNNQDMENQWLVFTGALTGANDLSKYHYLDNVHLFRPCDFQKRCITTTGQICPTVAVHSPPLVPFDITGIGNVRDMRVKVYSNSPQPIFDQTFHNGNGLPNFSLSRLNLPVYAPSSTYHYEILFSNDCGSVKRSGNFTVLDTASYNLTTPWVDTTANWSEVPVPCCLTTLTLQNMQIVGNVSYIVRDQITVQGGVSVASGSHVIIQAGNVVEMDSVEFDGTNSTVEILEIPCPNRMAGNEGCTQGSSMVIDADTVVSYIMQDPIADPLASSAMQESQQILEIGRGSDFWAYPNPCHDKLTFGYSIDEDATCSLVIFDLQMRPLKKVLEGKFTEEGEHELSIEVSSLPAGVYFVQLVANGNVANIKLVKE